MAAIYFHTLHRQHAVETWEENRCSDWSFPPAARVFHHDISKTYYSILAFNVILYFPVAQYILI